MSEETAGWMIDISVAESLFVLTFYIWGLSLFWEFFVFENVHISYFLLPFPFYYLGKVKGNPN